MTFTILLRDELQGFYKSKVMLFLWIGLPILAIFIYAVAPDAEDLPLSVMVALVISSLSGTLAAIMLVVAVINERQKGVYQLFLIRPIRRSHLLIAKFSAVYLCILVATTIALAIGVGFDRWNSGVPVEGTISLVASSFSVSLAVLAVSSAVGLLIGVVSPSILVGAILVLYLGNQISGGVGVVSTLYLDSDILTLGLGIGLSAIIMATSIFLFNRRQF